MRNKTYSILSAEKLTKFINLKKKKQKTIFKKEKKRKSKTTSSTTKISNDKYIPYHRLFAVTHSKPKENSNTHVKIM